MALPHHDALLAFSKLPNPGYPIAFFHCEVSEARSHNSHSYANLGELEVVVRMVLDIIREHTVHPKDIGVITPYTGQKNLVRGRLQLHGCSEVTVGTVEEYQGQERDVIIISTVRSTPALVSSDMRFHLGFMAQPKRINVAISRAKKLLIIIGNGRLLCMDPTWREVLTKVCESGGSDTALEELCVALPAQSEAMTRPGVTAEEDTLAELGLAAASK